MRISILMTIAMFILFGGNKVLAQKNGVLDAYVDYEEYPRFPGCEGSSEFMEDIEECAELRFIQYLYANVTIPEEARTKGVQGVISAKFKVDDKGKVSEVSILKGLGEGCDEALKTRLENMPTWIPGKNKGKAAAAEYQINFKVKL
jgi:TonB family protein